MTELSKVDEIFALRGPQPVAAGRAQSERQASPFAKVEELFALKGQSDALREECPEKVDRIFVLQGHPSRRKPTVAASSSMSVRPPEAAIDFRYLKKPSTGKCAAAVKGLPKSSATTRGQLAMIVEAAPGNASAIAEAESRMGMPIAKETLGKHAWLERTLACGTYQRIFSMPAGGRIEASRWVGQLADGVSLKLCTTTLAGVAWQGSGAAWHRDQGPIRSAPQMSSAAFTTLTQLRLEREARK